MHLRELRLPRRLSLQLRDREPMPVHRRSEGLVVEVIRKMARQHAEEDQVYVDLVLRA